MRCILPDTPDVILLTTGTDVFEVTIGSLTYTPDPDVIDDLVEQAWERFGYRPIGDYNYEDWLLRFNNKVKYEYRWYLKALPLILSDTNLSPDESMTVTTGSVVNVIATDVTGSNTNDVDNTTTNNLTNTSTTTNNLTHTDANTDTITQEVMPDTTGSSTYLSGRTIDTIANTGRDTGTVGISGTNGGTVRFVGSDDGTHNSSTDTTDTSTTDMTTTNKTRLSINVTLEIAKKLSDLNDLYLDRLESCFMNRW